MEGDAIGAGLELLSGIASMVPGLGTTASLILEGATLAYDAKFRDHPVVKSINQGITSNLPMIATTAAFGPLASIPILGIKSTKLFASMLANGTQQNTETDEISNNVKEIRNEVKTKSERQLSITELISNTVNQFLNSFISNSSEQITTTQDINNSVITFKNEHMTALQENLNISRNINSTMLNTNSSLQGIFEHQIQQTSILQFVDANTGELVTVTRTKLNDLNTSINEGNQRLLNEFDANFTTLTQQVGTIPQNIQTALDTNTIVLANVIERQTVVLYQALEDIRWYLSKISLKISEMTSEINDWFATVCRAISNIKVDIDIKDPSLIRFG